MRSAAGRAGDQNRGINSNGREGSAGAGGAGVTFAGAGRYATLRPMDIKALPTWATLCGSFDALYRVISDAQL